MHFQPLTRYVSDYPDNLEYFMEGSTHLSENSGDDSLPTTNNIDTIVFTTPYPTTTPPTTTSYYIEEAVIDFTNTYGTERYDGITSSESSLSDSSHTDDAPTQDCADITACTEHPEITTKPKTITTANNNNNMELIYITVQTLFRQKYTCCTT